jgi:hypothetical protein
MNAPESRKLQPVIVVRRTRKVARTPHGRD